MRFSGKDKSGVRLERDCYADHFAGPSDLKYNYSVTIHGDVIDEDEDHKELAKRVERAAKRMLKISAYLKRTKRP